MTPEQLDEIENRQAAALWIGGPTAAFAQDTLLLVKALREAREEWAYEWEQRHQMEVKLLATEAEVERLREALRQVHALAEKGRDFAASEAVRDIYEITKGMVE